MLLSIIGESCTGKSTLAEKINNELGGIIFSGKDYLRLAKNEDDAKTAFLKLLVNATRNETDIIYVISEIEHIGLLPDRTIRVLITADIKIIKERFSRRMNGNLPLPVATMLEKKHGRFDDIECDYKYSMDSQDVEVVCNELLNVIR